MSTPESTDYDWEIDIGVDIKATTSLRLDSAIIEQKAASFYQSQQYDFRDLDFDIIYAPNRLLPAVEQTLEVRGLKGDQALTQFNFAKYVSEFTQLYNGGVVVDLQIDLNDAFGHLRMIPVVGATVAERTNSICKRINFISDGWRKLGFQIGVQQANNGVITSPQGYDFAPPSTFVIQIIGIPFQGSIQNKYGSQILASIPVEAPFGSRVVWTRQSDSDNIVYLTQPVYIRRFRIRVLSCDQMPIQSIRTIRNNTDFKLGATGNNDVEAIFVITTQ